jgi:hypothetical protein
MLRTVKATIDERGNVTLAESVSLDGTKPALVTILDDEWSPLVAANEAALLAESALAEDWLRPEEDEAWKHLVDLPDLDTEEK